MWDNQWIHVRASNTEPILRFSAEAKSESAVESLHSKVEAKLQQV
jgi:phosphomannomutase